MTVSKVLYSLGNLDLLDKIQRETENENIYGEREKTPKRKFLHFIFYFFLFHPRYMIPRYTDLEEFFTINHEDGIIKTTRPLDREAQAWHNISVSATEIGRSLISFPGF